MRMYVRVRIPRISVMGIIAIRIVHNAFICVTSVIDQVRV